MSTTRNDTAALVREAFAAVPTGAMYYLTSIQTPAGGGTAAGSRARVNELARALRAALDDARVTNMTVFVLFDGERGGTIAHDQIMLPIGGSR